MSEDTPDPDDLRERLEALAERLDEATEEADYVAVEAELEEFEEEVGTLEEELDDEEVVEELTGELDELGTTLEAERGPYVEDVTAVLDDVVETIKDDEWTDAGELAVLEAVEVFLDAEVAAFDDVEAPEGIDGVAEAVTAASEALEAADLDVDDDTEAIEAALEAANELAAAVDDAETWSDLSVREKLEVSGFYDILDHRKDYPPEWSALKAHEEAGNVDMILLAHDLLDSQFMEEHCLEALKRLGPIEALEPMMELAQRRDPDVIDVLGRIGDDEPVEMLVGFVEEGPNRPLELVLLQSLGRIGSEDATQTVANRLLAEDALVRSVAARSLGMIGDTRAVDPLADVLAADDDANVRGSAAWALNEIGTEAALEAVVEHGRDDRSYLVEVQVGRARSSLEPGEGAA